MAQLMVCLSWFPAELMREKGPSMFLPMITYAGYTSQIASKPYFIRKLLLSIQEIS